MINVQIKSQYHGFKYIGPQRQGILTHGNRITTAIAAASAAIAGNVKVFLLTTTAISNHGQNISRGEIQF